MTCAAADTAANAAQAHLGGMVPGQPHPEPALSGWRAADVAVLAQPGGGARGSDKVDHKRVHAHDDMAFQKFKRNELSQMKNR